MPSESWGPRMSVIHVFVQASDVVEVSGPIRARASTQLRIVMAEPSAIIALPILAPAADRSEMEQRSRVMVELLARIAGAVPVWPSPVARPVFEMKVER